MKTSTVFMKITHNAVRCDSFQIIDSNLPSKQSIWISSFGSSPALFSLDLDLVIFQSQSATLMDIQHFSLFHTSLSLSLSLSPSISLPLSLSLCVSLSLARSLILPYPLFPYLSQSLSYHNYLICFFLFRHRV